MCKKEKEKRMSCQDKGCKKSVGMLNVIEERGQAGEKREEREKKR